jgi:uncharacterized protein YcfJ
MKQRSLTTIFCAALLAGCASTSTTQQQWTPTVDTYNDPRPETLSRDMEECRALALQASGPTTEQTARSAATKGALGAAVGAGLGAVLSDDNWRGAREGAAVGAAAGALAGGVGAASQTDSQFKRAFSSCMRQRGHTVIN